MMASRYEYTHAVKSAFILQDTTDDGTDVIPTIGLKTSMSLRNRFIGRLGELIGHEIALEEDVKNESIKIYMRPNADASQGSTPGDKHLMNLRDSMKDSLGTIAVHSAEPAYNQACEDLRVAVLAYTRSNIDKAISSLGLVFDTDVFQDFMDAYIMPECGSTIDEEVGSELLSLYAKIKSYDCSMESCRTLVQQAAIIAQSLINLRDRLKYLLRKAKAADELYELICKLGFPERVYKTMVRAARTSKIFHHTTFCLAHLPLAKPTPLKYCATNIPSITRGASTAPKPASPPRRQNPQLDGAASQLSSPSPLSATSSCLPSTPKIGAIMDAVQRFLTEEDRHKTFLTLQPTSKQETARLIGTVTRGQLLPVATEAWYVFGFVTAKNEEEERQLGGLYATILNDTKDPQQTFRNIQRALTTNTLVNFIDMVEHGYFREHFPRLEAFLRAPAAKRSTVWRLKQFILDKKAIEPPACLRRDYGFKFCKQREEVLLLKEMYVMICNKVNLKDLHSACMHGRIFETAIQKGVFIDAKHQRLLKNDYPSPFVGYDDDRGMDNYRGSLFKTA